MVVSWLYPVLSWVGVLFLSGSTQKLTNSDSVFKTSQERGGTAMVSTDRLEETGIKLGTPGYKVSGLSTTPHWFSF